MQNLSERVRSNSGIEAQIGSTSLIRERALYTLYSWLIILIMFTITTSPVGSDTEFCNFLYLGASLLSLSFIALVIIPKVSLAHNLLPTICFSFLSLYPGLYLDPKITDYRVIYDLYAVGLIVIPAFIGTWSWKTNALTSGLAALCICYYVLFEDSIWTLQSVILIIVSATIS